MTPQAQSMLERPGGLTMSVQMVPRRSPASIRGIRWTRHALQSVVVAFIAYTVWAKATVGPGAPSGEAFCPFGGFETLFTWVTTGRTVAHVHTANLVLAGTVVLLTLAARGAFCGWLCPFGAIQEAVHGAGDAVANRALRCAAPAGGSPPTPRGWPGSITSPATAATWCSSGPWGELRSPG
jgi:hypothetical protein